MRVDIDPYESMTTRDLGRWLERDLALLAEHASKVDPAECEPFGHLQGDPE